MRGIRTVGLEHTREDIVRGQLVSEVGEPYDPDTVKEDLQRLDRLGVFSSIDAVPLSVADGVVIEVRVRETYPHIIYPAFDKNDENGFSEGVGATSINLFGRAITATMKAQFGQATTFSFDLTSPWRLRMPWWYAVGFDQGFRPNKLHDFQETSSEFDAMLGRQIGPSFRIGSRFTFTSLKSDVGGRTLSPVNRDSIPGLGSLLGHDTRDLLSNPHRGWWNQFDVTQNGGFLGGDGDYLTANVDVRRFQPLARRGTVALFSLITLQKGDPGKEIPLYRDCHIGGTNTIRGWSLGARHGKDQFITTFEYRHEILRPRTWGVSRFRLYTGIHLAAFCDAGTAWDDGGEFTRNFIGGGGFGFRLVMPFFSLVRFEFGLKQPGGGLRFHFGLGEKAEKQRSRVR